MNLILRRESRVEDMDPNSVLLSFDRAIKLIKDVVSFCETGYFAFMFDGDRVVKGGRLTIDFPSQGGVGNFRFNLAWTYAWDEQTEKGPIDHSVDWFYPFESKNKIEEYLENLTKVMTKILNVKDENENLIEWDYNFDYCHGEQYIRFRPKTFIDFPRRDDYSDYVPTSEVLLINREYVEFVDFNYKINPFK